MKKVVFIIAYFGKLPNYFPIFLESCKKNEDYNWLLFTDDDFPYEFPSNFKKFTYSLKEFNMLASKKIGININITDSYKLCDFKPFYGLIFEDYILHYHYWGHCDCDLIFGNLKRFLPSILDDEYDKVFAAGHLTLYRNNYENNRMCLSEYNGKVLYKEVLNRKKIFAFDEDYPNLTNSYDNIHSIFIENNKKIYVKDYSFNLKVKSAKYVRMKYDPDVRNFIECKYIKAKYYWENGDLYSININNEKEEYIYIHFQMRKMRIKNMKCMSNCYKFLPDRIKKVKNVSKKITSIDRVVIGFPYLFWFDFYKKRIEKRRKVK